MELREIDVLIDDLMSAAPGSKPFQQGLAVKRLRDRYLTEKHFAAGMVKALESLNFTVKPEGRL